MTYARQGLDTQMRRLLASLEIISAIPACNYDATRSSDDSPGGRKPPGDYGYRTFAAWYGPPFHDVTATYPGCRSDREREECIKAAKTELDHLRKGESADPESMETQEATRARMLEETEGWSLDDVARSHWRTSPTIMRKLRLAAGLNAETGKPPKPDMPGLDLASRARDLKNQGMSLRQIAMCLDTHKFQVTRFLRKVA